MELQSLGLSRIYAGLDEDGIAKLFFVDKTGNIHHVYSRDWHRIVETLGAVSGEMLIVSLAKEQVDENCEEEL